MAETSKQAGVSAHKKQRRTRRAGRTAGELIGEIPATKARRGGHQKMLRYKPILKVLRMNQNTNGNRAGIEVPRVCVENGNDGNRV